MPGEGSTLCDQSADVDLVAVPAPGNCFLRWTGDVGMVADVWSPSTTITMDGDYAVTASFSAQASIWDVFDVIAAYANIETSIWNVFRLIGSYAR